LKSYGERKLLDLMKYDLQAREVADRTIIENLIDKTTQKQQQTWKSDNTAKCSSY